MPFDIGFFELCVIAIIGLLVLGPERLPVAARAIGRWIGKARRAFTSFKSEIDRELQIDELRRQLNEQQAKMDQFMNQRPLDDMLNETPEELKSKIEQTRQDFDQQRQHQADDTAQSSENRTSENRASEDRTSENPATKEGVSERESTAQTSVDDAQAEEFSGCDNPVEYEPLPQSSSETQSDEPTIHPSQSDSKKPTPASSSDGKA
ncbi:MAG: twin-arginine translocase subunit TatB [Gammaproteobacteria bacterium]|nr:twin-arginine translocase subunit TatB [Gammaproteobacteria bacterium]